MSYASLLFGAADSLLNYRNPVSAGLPFSFKILQGSSTKKEEHICDNSFSINLLKFIGFMDEDYQLEYVFLRRDGIPDHLKKSHGLPPAA